MNFLDPKWDSQKLYRQDIFSDEWYAFILENYNDWIKLQIEELKMPFDTQCAIDAFGNKQTCPEVVWEEERDVMPS